MMTRAYNFNAGPAAFPLPVLEAAQKEMLDYQGTGMSVAELSHRSVEYDQIHHQAMDDLRELLAIPDDYEILFLQGGASHQFMMIPANFALGGELGYADTGVWSTKAMEEAAYYGPVYKVSQGELDGYRSIPQEWHIRPHTSYVHMTSNNTIYGTAYREYPQIDVPLVADMSSDILSKPIDVEKFHLIYAGAQKNIGPAGVTVVIVRRDWLAKANTRIPKILRYQTHVEKQSLYNTAPTYPIYLLGKVLAWIKGEGGVLEMQRRAQRKSAMLYEVLDSHPDVYAGHAKPEFRSLMNVTFTLCDAEKEKEFLQLSKEKGFVGIKGHRLVGGCRASIYNAVPEEAVAALAQWMEDYAKALKGGR